MKPWPILLVAVALPASADLYRWVDPQTGSVKYSTAPPPWFGDSENARRHPPVEVIQYKTPGAAKAPEKPAALTAAVAQLETRWASLLQGLASAAADPAFEPGGIAFQQQQQAFQTVSAELDRLDPAGAQRRKVQEAGVMESLRRGGEAQRPRPLAAPQ